MTPDESDTALDAKLVRRIGDAAKRAPSHSGLVTRAQHRLRHTQFAVEWTTRGPKKLQALVEQVRKLDAMVDQRELDVRGLADACRQIQEQIETTLGRIPTGVTQAIANPDVGVLSEDDRRSMAEMFAHVTTLASLTKQLERLHGDLPGDVHDVVGEVLDRAHQDLATLPVARGAVRLASEIAEQRQLLQKLEQQLHDGPSRLESATTQLEGDIVAAEAAAREAEAERNAEHQRAAQVSAELEHLEHATAEAQRRVRNLTAEAKVVEAAVEARDPGAARRVYHLFREAAHHVEYKREAEEAREAAADSAERHDALSAAYRELIEDHERTRETLDTWQDEANALRTALYDVEDRIAQLHLDNRELADELERAWEQCREAHARGRPITHLPPALREPLYRARLLTFGEIADHTEEELLQIPDVGPARVREIRSLLKDAGLELRGEWHA